MAPRRSLSHFSPSKRLLELAALLMPVALLVAPALLLFRSPVVPQDEGTVLVYPDLVLHGAIPNHSFESVYGPENLFAIAAGYAIGGHSVATERTIGLLYRLLIVAGVYVMLRPYGRWRASIGSAITAVAVVTDFGYVALAWMGGLAFAVWALVFLLRMKPDSRVTPFVAGALVGTALGMRPDLVLALMLAIVVVSRRLSFRSWMCLGGGLLVGLVPTLVNLAQAGPAEVIRGELIQPLLVVPAGRGLPLTFDHNAAVVAALTVMALLALGAIGWSERRRELADSRPPTHIALACFGLGLMPYYLSRADLPHALSAFAVPLSAVALLWPPNRFRIGWQWLARLALSALPVLGLLVATGHGYAYIVKHSVTGSVPHNTVVNAGRSIPVGDASQAAALSDLLHRLDNIARSTHARSLFVGPADLSRAPYDDTYLYFMLPNLHPVSFYLEMEPGVANTGARLADDLKHTDIVVTSTAYLNWDEPNSVERRRSQAANHVLAADFRLVSVSSPWRIYVRR